jgi:signal transduction histidine kinase
MRDRLIAVGAGLVVAAAGLSGVGWVDHGQTVKREDDLALEARVTARQFASRVEAALDRHRVGIEQMAHFWEYSDRVTEAEFDHFAAATLALNPLCLRIVRVDANARVSWVYPPEANEALVGFDVRTHPQGYEAFVRARDTRRPALSEPLALVGGAPGFIITAPIFRGGGFDGAAVCSFRVDAFFEALLLPEVGTRYLRRVSDGSTVLYRSPGAMRDSALAAAEGFTLAGRTWRISVAPRPEVLAARVDGGRATLWGLGALSALLLGAGAGFLTARGLAARRRLSEQGRTIEETRLRLDSAMEQLIQAEKMSALGELVSGVAHEINNPLATILGYSQLALERDPPETIRKYLATAAAEAERAGAIVRNLLTFARKHAPERKPTDLNAIVESTLELKAYHFRVSRIALIRDLDPSLPTTMLDAHQIRQVLLNLLNNAEQAFGEERAGRIVRVTTRAERGLLRLEVADNGPGIPVELHERIFEPFFTTKGEGKGTGLGLSLCYGIVREHGGSIRVEGGPGRGARFVVELPVLEGTDAEANPSPARPETSRRALRILVVDDVPSVRAFLTDFLEGKGHEVAAAADAPEAVRKIQAESFDVIVCDMKMPQGSGREVYAAALARSPALGARVVFTTGDGASAETQRFIRETGAAVIPKPCRIEAIEEAVQRAAER